MARPKGPEKASVTLMLPPKLVQQVDQLRHKTYPPRSRSETVEQMIRAALEK